MTGILCPRCGSHNHRVYKVLAGPTLRRRIRICQDCDRRFRTVERTPYPSAIACKRCGGYHSHVLKRSPGFHRFVRIRECDCKWRYVTVEQIAPSEKLWMGPGGQRVLVR